MSISYGVEVTLKAQYSKKNIKKIIEKGKSIGFIYFDTKDAKNLYCLDIENAVKEAMNKSPEIISDGGPYIDTKFEDTRFFFRITEQKYFFTVSLDCFSSTWERVFWNSNDILKVDFARYIRLLLKLCEEFIILELKTEEI